jgi:hypothetical protein
LAVLMLEPALPHMAFLKLGAPPPPPTYFSQGGVLMSKFD